MRSWLFHPLVFYPLAIVFAALVILVSLRPQAWPREPAPAEAQMVDGALVFAGEGFNAPDGSPEQNMTVTRDFWGHPLTLRIAVKPDQPPPTPAEQGVRILMTREQAQLVEGRPVTVEVTYDPLPVNAAHGLAVSLQGIGPAEWVSQAAPPQPGTLRFELPPQMAVSGIGLRATAEDEGGDQAYGLEITRIRLIPHA